MAGIGLTARENGAFSGFRVRSVVSVRNTVIAVSVTRQLATSMWPMSSNEGVSHHGHRSDPPAGDYSNAGNNGSQECHWGCAPEVQKTVDAHQYCQPRQVQKGCVLRIGAPATLRKRPCLALSLSCLLACFARADTASEPGQAGISTGPASMNRSLQYHTSGSLAINSQHDSTKAMAGAREKATVL